LIIHIPALIIAMGTGVVVSRTEWLLTTGLDIDFLAS